MNKKEKGSFAELIVASRLIEMGFTVSFPYGGGARYDLLAEKSNRFYRVQVKYVTPKNGAMEVNCRSSNNWSVLPYSTKDIDLIAAFNPKSTKVYFIEAQTINTTSFKLRLDPTKNNQKENVHHADNFLELKV